MDGLNSRACEISHRVQSYSRDTIDSEGERGSKVQGFETRADGYIDKPFSLELLMAQIICCRIVKVADILKHP